MKHFIPTAKIASAGLIVEQAAVIKPVKAVRWELQRSVPAHVKSSLTRAANEADAREIRAIVGACRSPKRARPVILG